MDENRYVVIDIETLSIDPNSVILDFSAVYFDPASRNTYDELAEQSFRAKFDVGSQKKSGYSVSKNTLDWWRNQEGEVQKIVKPSKEDVSLSEGLKSFIEWCHNNRVYRDKSVQWFSRGVGFDFPIIENKFIHEFYSIEDYNDHTPWFFWAVNDIRTVIRTATLDFSCTKLDVSDIMDMSRITLHNSRDDCILAAAQLQLVMNAG